MWSVQEEKGLSFPRLGLDVMKSGVKAGFYDAVFLVPFSVLLVNRPSPRLCHLQRNPAVPSGGTSVVKKNAGKKRWRRRVLSKSGERP